MAVMSGNFGSSLWHRNDSLPFDRQNETFRCRQKRLLPTDCPDDQECSSKRFASEETVATHLRELHISSPHINHPHPLMITAAVTDCPRHTPNQHHITGNNESVLQYPWQQVSHASVSQEEWNKEPLMRGSSSFTRVGDTSSGGSWSMEEERDLPRHPVQAHPDSEEIWNSGPSEQHTTSSDTTHSVKGSPSSCSLPWTHWRPVSMDDVSSDSSDGGNEGPERPLSVWIAPELIQCAQRPKQAVPQSVLEKYNKPVGMELVLWVDPHKRLKDGCVQEGKDVTVMTEPADMC